MPVHAKDLAKKKRILKREPESFNRRTGAKLASVFGSMGFFWICVCLDILALPGLVLTVASSLGVKVPAWAVAISVLVVVVSFLSQTVIQLLALPVIQYSGNIQQELAEALADATYQNSSESAEMLIALMEHAGLDASKYKVAADKPPAA
jgi:hypothetical protein